MGTAAAAVEATATMGSGRGRRRWCRSTARTGTACLSASTSSPRTWSSSPSSCASSSEERSPAPSTTSSSISGYLNSTPPSSMRQFATKARNKRRPMRVADGGTWKASDESKTVRSKKVGGIDVGQKFTMVFYERRFEGDQNPIKTNWGMHEFTKIIPGTKN
uniref:NAC domain-containing protein n=1 Tax=Oryza glumipatula TaxID=40148 RepID=A0A0E0BA43_9ORYZ